MTQIEYRRSLVKRVKAGDQAAERELVDIFRRLYRPHRSVNYLYDPDEMYAAYLIAAWNAVYRAKLDVGDPVMFCVRRGSGAMLDYYRAESKLKLVLVCGMCSSEWPYDRPYIGKVCRHCGNDSLKSHERTTHSRLSLERASAHHDTTTLQGQQERDKSFFVELLNIGNKENKVTLSKQVFFDFLITLVEDEGKKATPALDPVMLKIAKSALANRIPFRDEAMLQYGKSSAWSVYAEGVIARFLSDRTNSHLIEGG